MPPLAQAPSAQPFVSKIDLKEAIKTSIIPLQMDIGSNIASIYSPGAAVTMSDLEALHQKIVLLVSQQKDLQRAAEEIFAMNPSYQDPTFQTVIPDSELTSLDLKKVFDTLRDCVIILDANGNIVQTPVTPSARSYPVTTGGKLKRRSSRRLFKLSGR
jgi:hypothetical protein